MPGVAGLISKATMFRVPSAGFVICNCNGRNSCRFICVNKFQVASALLGWSADPLAGLAIVFYAVFEGASTLGTKPTRPDHAVALSGSAGQS
jgi:hypothetical protein